MACSASMSSILAALSVLSFIIQFPRLASGACYYPNGDTDSGHKSCTSAGVSVCCSEGHQCLSNGLCADPRYDNFQRVLRGGCTDSGWGSQCPSFCKTEWDHGDEAVYYCGNGKWCCDSHDCCSKSDSHMLDLGTPSVTATADKDTNNNNNNNHNNAQPTSATPANVQQSSAPAQVNDQPQSSQQPQQSSQQQQAPSSAPQGSPRSSAKQDSAKPASTRPASNSPSIRATLTSPSIFTTTALSPKDSTSGSSPNNTPATIVLISGYSIILPTNSPTSTISPTPAPFNPTVVGASIGAGGGVLTFLIVLFFCFYMPRRRQRKAELQAERGIASRSITTGDSEAGLAGRGAGAGFGGSQNERNRYGRGSGVLIELSADRMVELSAERDAKEMEGEGEKTGVGMGELDGEGEKRGVGRGIREKEMPGYLRTE